MTPQNAASQTEAAQRWWLLTVLSVVLLGVGIVRMAGRTWAPPSADSERVLGEVHYRLQVRHPALFSDWALFPNGRAAGGPATPARHDAGAEVIGRAAPPSMLSTLLLQWAWQCGLEREARTRAQRYSQAGAAPLLHRACGFILGQPEGR